MRWLARGPLCPSGPGSAGTVHACWLSSLCSDRTQRRSHPEMFTEDGGCTCSQIWPCLFEKLIIKPCSIQSQPCCSRAGQLGASDSLPKPQCSWVQCRPPGHSDHKSAHTGVRSSGSTPTIPQQRRRAFWPWSQERPLGETLPTPTGKCTLSVLPMA